MWKLGMCLAIGFCAMGLAAQGSVTKDTRTLRPQQEATTVAPASADTRVALLIGNSGYTDAPLKNPVNDARAMKQALEACGFQATLLEDAGKRKMEDAIRSFGERIRGGAVGLFYFAGHGVQAKGANYLIPVGARLESEVDVTYEGVDVGQVLDRMEAAKNGLNILILDACRNNPFARSWRSADRGLAQVSAPTGSLIAYATAPGRTAADGEGSHGAYTEALLEELKDPGVKLEEVFKRVRQKVKRGSNDAQVPWESNSTVGDFYFRQPIPLVQVSSDVQLESEWWRGIQDSQDAKTFEAYLGRFPEGAHATQAREKVRSLGRPVEAAQVTRLRDPEKVLEYVASLESKEEFARCIAGLGWVVVGYPQLDLDDYDLENQRWRIPLTLEDWAKPLVSLRRVDLALDRTKVRELLAVREQVVLVARLEAPAGQVRSVGCMLQTPLGPYVLGAQAPAGPGAPHSYTHPTTGLVFIRISPGTFQMGSPKAEALRRDDEVLHEVTLTHPFFMGRTPVTVGQFKAFVEATGWKTIAEEEGWSTAWDGKDMGKTKHRDWRNPGFPQTDQHPVVCVSYYDARAYLAWLEKQDPTHEYQLPTEAQWEYAARAGTQTPWYWGTSPGEGSPLANLADAAALRTYPSWTGTQVEDGFAETAPVGQFKPNPWGLFDMVGNVRQWCEDWYAPYPSGAVTDPKGGYTGPNLVVRGSSWTTDPNYSALARRYGGNRDSQDRASNIGFRLVCTPARK